jgi:hypothetical protein
MRATTFSITFHDDDWMFILDSLNDRLENLTDLHEGPFDLDFAEDIKHCETLMKVIEGRLTD